MFMHGLALALLAAAASQQPAPGPGPVPLNAIEEIARNRLVIEQVGPGQFRGAGWDKLIADGAAAHVFMIGEQHGTADIARFGAAVHRALAIQGYTHAAYEMGPYSTDVAEQVIRSGKGQLAAYIRKPGNALSLPFLFYQEEVDLAEQIVAASPDRANALWGLDQEFAAAGPIIAELLRRWAANPAERRAADAFAAKVATAPQLIAAEPWSHSDIEKAFRNNRRAKRLLEEIRLSNEIYAPFTGRGGSGYEANLLRETYMKNNYAARSVGAERRNGKRPKVFLKFGGYHAQKGFTGTNVPGLGNHLYEIGVPRGEGFVNVMVDCAGGETFNPMTNAKAPCEPYFSKDAVLSKVPRTGKLTLFDLRPLRKQLRRFTDMDQDTRQLILSFDYYLTIEGVQAATPTVPAAPS